MATLSHAGCSETRLEQQVRRLRNRLAEAWRDGCPPAVIHRIEGMISRRWQLIEGARNQYDNEDLQPE